MSFTRISFNHLLSQSFTVNFIMRILWQSGTISWLTADLVTLVEEGRLFASTTKSSFMHCSLVSPQTIFVWKVMLTKEANMPNLILFLGWRQSNNIICCWKVWITTIIHLVSLQAIAVYKCSLTGYARILIPIMLGSGMLPQIICWWKLQITKLAIKFKSILLPKVGN